jgi:hypothetical protein
MAGPGAWATTPSSPTAQAFETRPQRPCPQCAPIAGFHARPARRRLASGARRVSHDSVQAGRTRKGARASPCGRSLPAKTALHIGALERRAWERCASVGKQNQTMSKALTRRLGVVHLAMLRYRVMRAAGHRLCRVQSRLDAGTSAANFAWSIAGRAGNRLR